MKNKFGVYALLISLLTSAATMHASWQTPLKGHAKAEKMKALREYPNLAGKSDNEISDEMRWFRRKYSNGASYFNNLKFEAASRDAQAINSKSPNAPCNITQQRKVMLTAASAKRKK